MFDETPNSYTPEYPKEVLQWDGQNWNPIEAHFYYEGTWYDIPPLESVNNNDNK